MCTFQYEWHLLVRVGGFVVHAQDSLVLSLYMNVYADERIVYV